MWASLRSVFFGFSAVLGLLVYALQFQKACENRTPVQCVKGIITDWPWRGWVSPTVATNTTKQGRALTVINAGDGAIALFYASSCDVSDWGDDLLGETEVIRVGHRRTFELPVSSGSCCFDLKAIYGRVGKQKLKADICSDPTWTVSNRQ
jgi:hypothetical protein